MADEYKIRYSGGATPIEIQELSDGVTTSRHMHSDVEKTVGGSIEKSGGSTSTNIKGKFTHTTETTERAIEHSSIFNDNLGAVVDFLMIAITAAGSSGTPDVKITLDGTNFEHLLSGVGDFTILSPAGLDSANIRIKSSGATELAVVDILRGVFT